MPVPAGPHWRLHQRNSVRISPALHELPYSARHVPTREVPVDLYAAPRLVLSGRLRAALLRRSAVTPVTRRSWMQASVLLHRCSRREATRGCAAALTCAPTPVAPRCVGPRPACGGSLGQRRLAAPRLRIGRCPGPTGRG